MFKEHQAVRSFLNTRLYEFVDGGGPDRHFYSQAPRDQLVHQTLDLPPIFFEWKDRTNQLHIKDRADYAGDLESKLLAGW